MGHRDDTLSGNDTIRRKGSDSTAPLQDALIGVVLDARYLIKSKLGQGGFGAVYVASDQKMISRRVVVKVMRDRGTDNDWSKKKFKQEIEALTRINHPSIVGVFDSGETPDGNPYIVMEYVDGVTLRSLITPEGMSFSRVANIMSQMGRALTAAHQSGILHRDLKPENVMLQDFKDGDEHVKIIDFGVAKVKDSIISLASAKGQAVGTIAYMSPEQLSAQSLTAASDVYALGVIAYEILTGRRPLNPESAFQLLGLQRSGVRIKPTQLRPSLPQLAESVILKALSFDTESRYERARDFGDLLSKALLGDNDQAEAETQAKQPSEGSEILPLETAHVLFMDIVGYTKLMIDEQTQRLRRLQNIVRGTTEFRRAQTNDQLIRLPTGDGMALVFFGDLVAPVRCALEVSRALQEHPEIELRLGVHTGPVHRIADINMSQNVAGGGINIAQRVMDCGDAGYILLSKEVADALGQVSEWKDKLFDLGEVEVKHGVKIHVFSLYTGDTGKIEPPGKMRSRLPSQREAGIKRAGDPDLGPIVFKLCDRGPQVEAFSDFFIRNLQQREGIPQIYFVHGQARECHDSLVERLMHTKIKHIVEKKWGEQRGVVVLKKPSWPHEGDLMQLQQELRRSLFAEFDPAYMADDLSARALSDLASTLLAPLVLIRHNVYTDRWSTLTKELLIWYLAYWSALNSNPISPQFLIFLNIIYPSAQVRRRWTSFLKFTRFDKRSIQSALDEIALSHSAGCACLVLNELLPPRHHDVGEWFSRHNIYDVKEQSDHLNKIFGQPAVRLSMADIEHELRGIHQSFVREKGNT